MSKEVKIYSTKDYDTFQHYPSNRRVSQVYVQQLVDDPTFPDKAKFSPIVVNNTRHIIDGQHRFYACIRLGIPIYYIIDSKANQADMRTRNTQSYSWKTADYVHSYAQESPSYAAINKIMEKHKVTSSFILPGIKRLTRSGHDFTAKFKKGLLNFDKEVSSIEDFYDNLIPVLKTCIQVHGRSEAAPLFQRTYVDSFAYFYEHEPDIFQKILRNLPKYSHGFIYASNSELARQNLLKISRFRCGSGIKKLAI